MTTTHADPTDAPLPSRAALEALFAHLQAAEAAIADHAQPLTIAERRRLLRMRPGGAAHVAAVVALAARHGITIPGIAAEVVDDDARLVDELTQAVGRLDALRGRVADLNLTAQSRLWRAGTTMYSILARLVTRFPALQRDLGPMATFLASKHKSAPTAIRPQEKNALARARRARASAKAPPPADAPVAGPTPAE
jgi:hypothetical protein